MKEDWQLYLDADICIYAYIYREREDERDMEVCAWVCLHFDIHIDVIQEYYLNNNKRKYKYIQQDEGLV